MPPKKKAASSCDLCCRPIVDSKEDCIQCEGQCRLTFHRYCAGVSATHYKQFNSTGRPFVCMVCNQQLQNERVSQLAAELESLKAELTATKEQLARERLPCENCSLASSNDAETEQQPEGSDNAALQSNAEWSSMVKIKTKTKTKPSIACKSASYPERVKLVSPDERRFNVIIYGIKECKKGTPRHVRTSNDMKSVSDIIQGICPDIPSQAIRDSVRLGRYTEGRNRPLLAKLNRSCDVLSILASRQKLAQSETPGVFINERSTEATLLRQRKLLIESGTDKKVIRIRGNSIFVRKIKYGSANASEFKLHTPVIPSDSEESSDNTLLSEPSMASAIQPIVSSDNHDPPNEVPVTASDWLCSPSHNSRIDSFNNPITCCYYNARSLVNKLSKFQSLIYSSNYDIVLVSETWLSDSIFDQEILPTNYCIFRKDRHSRGGGAMIAVRDTIPTIAVKISTALVSNSIEVVSVNLMLRKPITLCCIYIPPCTDDLQLTEVIQYFSTLITLTQEIR